MIFLLLFLLTYNTRPFVIIMCNVLKKNTINLSLTVCYIKRKMQKNLLVVSKTEWLNCYFFLLYKSLSHFFHFLIIMNFTFQLKWYDFYYYYYYALYNNTLYSINFHFATTNFFFFLSDNRFYSFIHLHT